MQPILNNAARLSALRKSKSPKPGQGKGESYDMSDSNEGKDVGDMMHEIGELNESRKKRDKEMYGKKGK
jgi:hypothetical protein